MSLVKYRVKEVAADFGKTPKEIAEIVGKYFEKPRSNTQVLTDEQLNVVFDYITQHNQISSLEQVFAVAPAPKTPEKAAEALTYIFDGVEGKDWFKGIFWWEPESENSRNQYDYGAFENGKPTSALAPFKS